MKTTLVSYRGRGVTVLKALLETAGQMLIHEGLLSSKTPDDRGRFSRMARDFALRFYGRGCAEVPIEEVLGAGASNEKELLRLVALARQRLSDFGEQVPTDYLDQFLSDRELGGDRASSARLAKVLDVVELLLRGGPFPDSFDDLSH